MEAASSVWETDSDAAYSDAHIADLTLSDSHGNLEQDEHVRTLTLAADEDSSRASSSWRSSRHSSKPSGSGFSESTASVLTSVEESSVELESGHSTSAILPPPPQALEPVYEPETPLARRPPRRPLPSLPTGPRFAPLHSLPALPSSRLVLPIAEESTIAAEEKRAYARARGLDELFEAVSLSSETAVPVPLARARQEVGTSTISELPDYAPESGAAGLARIRSMVKREQRFDDNDQDAGEVEAARAAAREQAAEQARRQIELDARDSKAAIARRVEEEERDRRDRALAETESPNRKELDVEAIDAIEGLDVPPPPHEEAVAGTSGGDMLPLSDSKACLPPEATESQHVPTKLTPASSRLPPPPLPVPADYFSITPAASPAVTHGSRPTGTRHASLIPAAPVQTPAPRRSYSRRQSSLYPSGIEPFPASGLLPSPVFGHQHKTAALQKPLPSRMVSLGAPTSFYSTNVGLALDRDTLPARHHVGRTHLETVDESRLGPADTSSRAQTSPALVGAPAQHPFQGYVPASATSSHPGMLHSGVARARSDSSVSSITSARSAPSALYASPHAPHTHRSSLTPSLGSAVPAFYTAVTPDGPLLPFYAAPPSAVGGPPLYFTPSQGTGSPTAAAYDAAGSAERPVSAHAAAPLRTQSASPLGQAMSLTGPNTQVTPFLSPSPSRSDHSLESRDPNPGGGSVTGRLGTMRRLLGRSSSSNVK